jgi:hypothetical protein
MASINIPTGWSAEQAMAVVELLDDLREHIWARYQLMLLDAYRDEMSPTSANVQGRLFDDPI